MLERMMFLVFVGFVCFRAPTALDSGSFLSQGQMHREQDQATRAKEKPG